MVAVEAEGQADCSWLRTAEPPTSPTVDDDEARVEAGDWNLGVVGTAHSGALSRLGKTCTVVSSALCHRPRG